MRRAHCAIHLVFCLLIVTFMAPQAAAQDPGPIGPFAFDIRGALAGVGQNAELAETRGLWPDQLAPRGIGLNVGGHAYVLRWRDITFGIGVSALISSTTRTPSMDAPQPSGPTIKTRFTAISPELSLNFGDGDGWSYLSGGLGTSRMNVYAEQPTVPKQRRAGTLNYGGGARWFIEPNLAFSFDVRLYAISPLPQLGDQPGSPRMTRFAVNVGLSVR